MNIIVGNLMIHYQTNGQPGRPVVLMLHGWGDSLATFNALAAALAGRYYVVRLDLPGFGASQAPATAWHVADYVACVAAMLAKLKLEPAVMVGHSLGGRILLKGVGGGELRPKQLILIASAGLAKTRTARNRAYAVVAKIGKAVTLVPPFSLARASLRRRLYSHAASDYLTSGRLKDTFLNVIREDLSTSAARIHVPTLLIWGDADDQTPVTDGRRLLGLISGSKLRLVPGAGHFVHHDAPAEVAEFVGEFLA